MEWVLLLVLGVLAFGDPSLAAMVTLQDGTVIRGEVKSLQDGVYTVESESAGTLHIRADQIRSIDETDRHPPPASAAPPSTALADPVVAKLIADGDYAALASNPKIVALMQNPKVRAIIEALQ